MPIYQAAIFQLVWDIVLRPPTVAYQGFAPGPVWGDSVPDIPSKNPHFYCRQWVSLRQGTSTVDVVVVVALHVFMHAWSHGVTRPVAMASLRV